MIQTDDESICQTGITSLGNNHPYVVANDGARFLVPVLDRATPEPLTVMLNWPASVQK